MARPLSAALRSLLFYAIFYPGSLLFVTSGIAVSPLGTPAVRAVARAWAGFHHLLITALVGIRFELSGSIPPGPVLIAIKHQSMVETLEILRLAATPVVVLKRELADLPLFGWIARRYGVIPVDRAAGARALRRLLEAGREAVAAGRPVVIFPEGTRVAPGSTPPLRAGFAGLYRVLGLAVVPIALDSGRLWPRGFVKRAGTIRLKIGEPIPAGLPRPQVEALVHAAINALETPAG